MPPLGGELVTVTITLPDEWAKISGEGAEKDFLHVVEVYVSWCGPTTAITSTFKKINFNYNQRKIKFFHVRRTRSAAVALPEPRSSHPLSARTAARR